MTPNQHKEPALPSVAECDERIAEAQHVIDHPDEYDVEVRVDASRDKSRWTFNRRFAERVASLEEQLEAAQKLVLRGQSREAEILRLKEQLETLREAAEQVVRGCEAWPSWTTGHIGFTLRTALTSNPASEPETYGERMRRLCAEQPEGTNSRPASEPEKS